MTDKTIITLRSATETGSQSSQSSDVHFVNGVDVSGCEFFFRDNINGIFTQELCACMEEHTGTNSYKTQCLDNSNCYYKQSARKDERIKELEEEKKKGLQEYNNIGGCWGCGLQLSLNQYLKDIENHQQKLSQIAQLADKNSNTNVNDFENTYIGMINYLKANNEQIKQIAQGE